jgi:Fe(3+) dicitrate transport protein
LSPAQWESNPDFTRTPDDRIWIERYVPSITYERDLSDTSLLEVKAWGGYQDRFSRRQTGGGASANLDRQEFNFGGLDARLAHQYEAWENDHTFTGGATTYFSSSPRSRHLGTPRTDTSGTPVFDLDRYTYYGAVFAENRFRFGKFAVVPALRLEFVSLDVKENSNSSVTRSLIDDSYISVVPLGGLGLTYDLPAKNQVYANFSTSYRPKEYDDLANPTSNTQQSPSGLDESYVYQYEIGVRGQPATWCAYDTSLFFIDYDNVIETQVIGAGPDTERSNSGQARYYGWEGAAEADLIGIVDALADTQHGEKIGKLNLYGNVSLLHAEFVDGQFEGNRPSYAPDYIVKSGALYRLRDNVKVAMQGQFVGDYFWQDSNGAGTVGTKEVPSYVIWDLTGEIAVWKKLVSFVGGINNIFDRDYYSRVRADGIEPLPGRTFYAGVRIAWP